MRRKEPNNIDPNELNGDVGDDETKGQPTNETVNQEDNLTDAADKASEELDLPQQVEQLTKKLDDLNDSYLRLHAEYDNFR